MLGSLGVCVWGAQLQGSARHPSASQTVWTSDVVSAEHTDGRGHGRSQPPVETPVQVSSATETKVASAFFCSRSWHIRVWDLKSLGLVSDTLSGSLIYCPPADHRQDIPKSIRCIQLSFDPIPENIPVHIQQLFRCCWFCGS